MGMTSASGGGKKARPAPVINVTPLVDVVLVRAHHLHDRDDHDDAHLLDEHPEVRKGRGTERRTI